MKRFLHSVLPAFVLAISVGQIYAFTNFSTGVAECTGGTQKAVQFAFSLAVFFLGMGAAFFGRVVERNLRLATALGSVLFIAGLCVTALGVSCASLPLVYLGYGVLLGIGTGMIYIAPVKAMMLWFPKHRTLAAAMPVIAFGLGSTLSTVVYGLLGFDNAATARAFFTFAAIYALPMAAASALLRRPDGASAESAASGAAAFSYAGLAKDAFFLRSWLFMFLNISAGLSLIPLGRQMMSEGRVGFAEGTIATVIALCGVMNGGGRFLFAWWSDRLSRRIDILFAISAISAAAVAASFWPPAIAFALLSVNACYGAGFSVMPSILAERYGMADMAKVLGAVLSAWGMAGLAGNQAAMFVKTHFGGDAAVIAVLLAVYALNIANVAALRKSAAKG